MLTHELLFINPISSSDARIIDESSTAQKDSAQKDSAQRDSAQRDRLLKDATILVVEDNVSNFVLIARMLGYMGIHCEWKTSGYEVVEYADALPRLDLILMDIRLPYEDGFGALKKIRAFKALKNTRVVAVTAESSLEQMNKAKLAGFDGFLGKPLDMDRFPDQIRRILSGDPVWELS
jgi:two-component system, cell cycle response regulator DivK